MQYCEKCKVHTGGNRENCPLCQGVLRGEPTEEIFPDIPTAFSQYHFAIRTMIFVSIAAVVLSVAVNFMFPYGGKWWSVFVVVAVACMWLSLSSAIVRRHNIPKNIMWQVCIVSALAVFWDWFTHWHGWSIDYIIPLVCVLAMIAITVISKVMKIPMEEYMIYLILDGLFGIIPLLFLFLGWVNIVYPSVICVAVSILSFAALFSFRGENLQSEVKKRLHL